MKGPAMLLAVTMAFGTAGCTLVAKVLTGAAAGGAVGWFVAGPPGAAVGAGAGAVAVPIIVD